MLSLLTTGMKFLNPKKIGIGLLILVIGYVGFKLYLQRAKIEDLLTINAQTKYSLEQKLETIKAKDVMIESLEKDIKILNDLSEQRTEQIKKIELKNDETQKQIAEIKVDECIDSTMPDELIGLLTPETGKAIH